MNHRIVDVVVVVVVAVVPFTLLLPSA